MQNLCPNCGQVVPDGCDGFCPWCDCDLGGLGAAEKNADESSPSVGKAHAGQEPRASGNNVVLNGHAVLRVPLDPSSESGQGCVTITCDGPCIVSTDGDVYNNFGHGFDKK